MTRLQKTSLWVACTILAAVGCKNSKYCDMGTPCPTGLSCDTIAHACVSNGGAGGAAGHGGAGGLGGSGGHAGAGGSAPPKCPMVSCGTIPDAGPVCDVDAGSCVACLASTDCKIAAKPVCSNHDCVECAQDTDCTTAAKPICTNNTCARCTSSTQCQAALTEGGLNPVCDVDAGTCVMCTARSDCAATATTPICGSNNMCRACASDAECNGPQVCMSDGHCAASGEVLFVQSTPGCSATATGAGSMGTPFCNPNEAVDHLGMGSPPPSVIVLVGAQAQTLTIGATSVKPLVIGRLDTTNNAGAIPAVNMTAITVSGGVSATVRDLLVNGGTTPGSKGIMLTGMNTTLSLINVTVNLGTTGGLGIDAENAALLTMKDCKTSNNPGGGILLTNTPFDIEESTVTGNGPATTGAVSWGGIFVNASGNVGPVPAKLVQDTVTNNQQVGITCTVDVSTGSSDVLAASNIGGDVVSTCKVTSCGAADPSCGAQP